MYSIVRMQIVPGKYLLLALPIATIVVLLLSLAHFKKVSTVARSLSLVAVSLLLIVVNIYIYSASSATTTFLKSIEDKGYTYQEYSIIAKKDQHIKLATSHDQHAALLATDTNTDLVKAEVNNRTRTDYKNYSELTSLTVGLDNKEVGMAALKSSYVQLLQENNNPFYQSVEVLATFKIKVKTDTSNVKTDITKPFVVYISGIDTYGAIDTVSRSDVNILLIVNPQTHKILLVNTPRDYYVQLHGTTGVRDKLTHAGIYGIDMSVKTLEDLYDTHIDYYMRINFSSLTSIVDAIGGVNVFSDYTFKTDHYSFGTGYNQVDGKKALEFSRERHSFEDGDRTRGKNQQHVIEAIIDKMNNPKSLANYRGILASLQQALQTNMSSNTITVLINKQLNDLSKWQVESVSADGTGKSAPTYSMGSTNLYVMEPDTASLQNAKQKIRQSQ